MDNNSGSIIGRKLSKGLPVDTRQSEDNKERVSQTDANRGVEVLKNNTVQNSLKDSNGNTLTQEQAEFFKDTIVADNGRVVQHNLKTYNEGGRDILYDNLLDKGFSKEDVSTALQTMDKLATFFDELGTTYQDVADWNNAIVITRDKKTPSKTWFFLFCSSRD